MHNKEIAFVGLGRMGNALCAHLIEQKFMVRGFDADVEAQHKAQEQGITTYKTLEEMVSAFSDLPRTIWLMVPSRFVDDVLEELIPLLNADDTIIDGGNSFFKDSIERHQKCAALNINFIDCGTSGGVEGARHGASLMVGGEIEAVEAHEELFTAIAVQDGYARVGGPGAGHFTKMVHNAIEYGMIGALAEGVNILNNHKEGMGIDVALALKPFEHGSIISGNLVTWLAQAYNTPGLLEQIAGTVPKGETEMEMEYLITHEHVHILDAAVLQRKHTRTEPSFIGTLIAAIRNQFGGHQVIKK